MTSTVNPDHDTSGAAETETDRPDVLLDVRGVKVHFPIRKGIIFDKTDRPRVRGRRRGSADPAR